MCWRIPIDGGIPCTRSKLRILYPVSSIAFANSSGSSLTLSTLASSQESVNSNMSATLQTSRTEYASRLQTWNISRCLLIPKLPPLSTRYAFMGLSSSIFISSTSSSREHSFARLSLIASAFDDAFNGIIATIFGATFCISGLTFSLTSSSIFKSCRDMDLSPRLSAIIFAFLCFLICTALLKISFLWNSLLGAATELIGFLSVLPFSFGLL
mmetsp:Transcript_25123/g.28907  ORF Transcript_25123/g.28907 Transcript_25123/m.28907 type:complete len:212 (+) Transcript_25123:1826-2461(+)